MDEHLGKIYALSTIGGIAGTFFGGFFLIPNLGSIHILFMIAIPLILLIPLVDFKLELKTIIPIIIIVIGCISLMFFCMRNNENNGKNILNYSLDDIVTYDTQYGRVLIYNSNLECGKKIRILNIDSGYESATYIDEELCNELVFDYTKYYDLMFEANIEIKNTLMIGGAGYSYPKYFISKNLNKTMDVVEIDEKITEIAKQYFFLDKLINEYNLSENKRLNLITDDGRTYLNSNTKKYDAILNDAFSGKSPAETLTTLEAVQKIKKSLIENGVYLTNVVSSLEGKNSKFIKAEVNTLKQVFKNVYIVPCERESAKDKVQNNMIIATDDELTLEYEYKLNIEKNGIILTDDYCPIDNLIPQI